jgi:phosphopantetheine adenylyltransferase
MAISILGSTFDHLFSAHRVVLADAMTISPRTYLSQKETTTLGYGGHC